MDKWSFAARIVKYWYLLEFLGQSDFPTPKNGDKQAGAKWITLQHAISEQAIAGSERPRLEPHRMLSLDANSYPEYKVLSDEIHLCIGSVQRYLLADRLQQTFQENLELPENNVKSVCLIGMKCDREGKYLPGSVQISPLVWGIDCLLQFADRLTKENLADHLSMKDYLRDMESMDYDLGLVTVKEGVPVGEYLTAGLLDHVMEQVASRYLEAIFPSECKVKWENAMIYRRYKTEESKAADMEVMHASDLANSFFTADLSMVRTAIEKRDIGSDAHGQAILDYITGAYAEENPELDWLDVQKRIDVHRAWKDGKEEERADFFHQYLDVARGPLGKWPSQFMPCLMQQLAINLSWRPSQDNQVIFSVNGPPGTGKTTLLKEIIAGNIVERASLLAQYPEPDAAFVQRLFQDGDETRRGYSKFYWCYYDFADDRLKDYGMLVASCNNAAVENITKELPDGKALLKGVDPVNQKDPAIRQGLSEVQKLFGTDTADRETYRVWNQDRYETRSYPDIFFTKLANELAGKKDGEWDRWGLISAPFGKTSNLRAYIRTVLKNYINSFGSNEKIQQRKAGYPKAAERFIKQYERVKQMEQELRQVSGARSRFTAQKAPLENRIQSIEDEQARWKQEIDRAAVPLRQLSQQLVQAQQAMKDCEAALANAQSEVSSQGKRLEESKKQIQDLRQHIMELESSRRLLDVILELIHHPTMLSRTIQEQYQALSKAEEQLRLEAARIPELQQQLNRCGLEYNAKAKGISRIQNQQNSCLKRQKECSDWIDHLQSKIQECIDQIEQARQSYLSCLQEASARGGDQAMTVLDDAFFRLYDSENEADSTMAQVDNPWYTAAYNREREKLFYEALRLHKEFLLGSKACLWNFKNLLLLWNDPCDDSSPVSFSVRDKNDSFGPLFNTVFLLTPVLSTTFASAGSMMSSIQTPGEIGCLIIDEAGQAAPQMALGSLFRCRRAIVVGDPKQVEPVVTDELDLIKRVIRDDYNVYYQSKTHSVQEFADRLNPVGTIYATDEQSTWVGCPLVVHRRCISPMFEISNTISYGNMMKQQTAMPSAEKESTFCLKASTWINTSGSERDTKGKNHFVESQGQKAWALIRTAFQLTKEMPSLFVITPFTSVLDGMKQLIRSQPEWKMDARLREWTAKCIGTVHSFQGKEADQVIFLLGCDKCALPAVRWVNANIVNVAVTRAKYRLYVIGDYTVWQHSPLFQKVKGILDSYAILALEKLLDNPDEPIT